MNVAVESLLRYTEPELLVQELASGRRVHVIDVRAREDCNQDGYIHGCRRFPLSHLRGRFAELECLRHEPIVVVSGTGATARAAAVALGAAGFPEVSVLRGGIARWLELGLPVDFGSAPPSRM